MQLKWPKKLLFNPEDRAVRLYRNVGNYLTFFFYLVSTKIKNNYKTSEF